MIKDSGERRSFETGAVRDVVEGKGRCDLLPACALLRLAKHYEEGAKKYTDRNWEKGIPMSVMIDSGMRHLLKYMDGQTDEDHLCAAAWNIIGAMWMEEKKPKLQDIPSRIEDIKKEWVAPTLTEVKKYWKPEIGETFYSPGLHINDGWFSGIWNDNDNDNELFSRGLVCKTISEASVLCQDLIDLINLSKKEYSNKTFKQHEEEYVDNLMEHSRKYIDECRKVEADNFYKKLKNSIPGKVTYWD